MKEEPKAYIKRVRTENGMTVKMFGDKVGKSPRTIQNYEQGRPMAPVFLAMIENIFGERIDGNKKDAETNDNVVD